jgi:hypothetical protein
VDPQHAPAAPPATNGHRPRAIDRARKAFHGVGRQRHEVPEWPDEAGQPLEVFFTPLSQADLEALSVQSPKTVYEEHVYLLITKLRDDQGQPLFDYRDKQALMTEVESSVILRLKNAIWATSSIQTVDEAKAILGQDTALEFRMLLADRLNKSIEEVNSWPLTHLVLWAAYCSLHPHKPGVPAL